MIIAALVTVTFELPVRARFELGRADFDAVVDGIGPQGSVQDWATLNVPSSVGGYEITSAYQAGANVILYEAHGSGFVGDAGFAYLPNGPDDRLDSGGWEVTRLNHLGGDWYSWQASL